MRLELLGSFELLNGGAAVALPMSAQRLLAFLALHERPLQRVYVAGTLWADTAEERANANLRTTLWRLQCSGVDAIVKSATHLQLADSVFVDVRDALSQAHRLLDPSRVCEGDDLVGSALSGDILSDWYDDWVLLEQERFRQLRLHALEALCERLTKTGQYALAIDAGLAAVAGEPLRESARRVLIQAFLAEGNVGEAVRQYRSYRETLFDQLAIAPSQLIEDLVAAWPTANCRHGHEAALTRR